VKGPQKQGGVPPVEYRFKPGQSGNPGGQVKGTRHKLNGDFVRALSKDFDENGIAAIKEARERDPMGYVKVIASLVPKQVEQSQPLDELTDAELVAGIALLRARLTGAPGKGTDTPAESSQTH
jgi:hypothetical protein